MKDGEIDYSRYSLRDLFQALDVIDSARYPKNYENIHKALAKASVATPSARAREDSGTTFPELAFGFSISVLLWIGAKVLISAAPELATHFVQGWNGAGISPGSHCESCSTGQE